MRSTILRNLIGLAVLAGCDDGAAGSGDEAITAQEQSIPKTSSPDPESARSGEEPGPATGATASAEACARVIVVAWKGAAYARDDVTRSKADARVRAEELRRRVVDGGEDFAEVARVESDAGSSGPRGGLIGTYARDGWPAAHTVLVDPVFGLDVGGVTEIVEAPYGYVFATRCAVEKVHTRHILVRYQGAKNAGGEVTRSKEEALALAQTLWARAAVQGADFAALAREHSEDSSAERGGDLGPLGRGLLDPAYEEAAFSLRPGAVSRVTETAFGFHVIERVR